ncbi:SDR family oxidoreductase [Fodinibius halophilus]|uniref:SDR family NAD(P)-dependent oxidoreductase n=1 Tax=Fodinibius halophilus TaxID=1736908 RepID=A0A6M1SZU1_9BACT|nr:SDR family NAD(P)-dependent oxidoreductase [Fodinibius halophilus]NGP89378.1 SDR family NAD(P)-dependent oxidoreductase [Fodinibius halophilus]
MVLENNTILITGGSSGIGLELAKRLLKRNNKVLICGRTLERLQRAKQQLPDLHYLQCDISNPSDCERLRTWVREEHADCNILINNAATVHVENFHQDDDILEKADTEIQTNLMAPIRLSKLFAPILSTNENPAIINITTGLVYVPRTIYPFYNATKSALHSFTQVLRSQSEHLPINIIEVQFPAVDTPWHKGTPPDIAISPEEAVKKMMTGIATGAEEVKVGKVKLLYFLSRIAPQFAFRKLNSL